MIKGIIFDFDGIIIDSETPAYQAWEETYRYYHQTFPLDQWRTIIGTADGKFDPAASLATRIKNQVSLEAITRQEQEIENALISKTELLPGIRNYLQSAKEMNIKIGISSSATADWVSSHLARLQISSYFNAITTQEEVELTKPYPYLYEKTINKLGLYPYQVIAIEDSPLGVTAAQTAGIFTIAVPNPMTRQMNLSHADLVVDSLDHLSLTDLLAYIAGES